MFSLRLKELREKKGYSQYSFADAFGVAQSTIGNWEAGKREPNLDTIQRLAAFFGVTVDYLIGREHSEKYDLANKLNRGKIEQQNISKGVPQKRLKTLHNVSKTVKREHLISFHLNDEELDRIWMLSKEANVSPSECLRQLLLTGEVKPLPPAELIQELLDEAKSQRNDLNQIATIIKKSGQSSEDIDEVLNTNKELIAELETLRRRSFGGIRNTNSGDL